MPRPSRAAAPPPTDLHPRNRHHGRYDFAALAAASPPLGAFITTDGEDGHRLDFGDPAAVRALNRALLRLHYDIAHWDLPEGYLCPPIPGRADYLHGLADLLARDHGGLVPRGAAVRALDIGTGANLIYPLIGHADYGWRFVGTDIDTVALRAAGAIIDANRLPKAMEVRRQPDPARMLAGVVGEDEGFDVVLCNPPFHASAAQAAEGSRRKRRNLGATEDARADARLNFGGHGSELWCPGGEAAFVARLIEESAGRDNPGIGARIGWFSSLVAKSHHLPALRERLQRAGAREVCEVPMAQGQKRSRFLAWSFLDAAGRAARSASR